MASITAGIDRGVLLFTALCALIIAWLSSMVYSWYRLRHIPGPISAKFSKLWLVRNNLTRQLHLSYYGLTKEYGPLVQVGPNILLSSDVNLFRKVHAARSPYRRSTWYRSLRFSGDSDNIVSHTDEDIHRELRMKMAPGYSGKETDGLEERINQSLSDFIDLIERKYVSTTSDYRPMDFAEKVSFFGLDVISDIAFGKPFGYLKKDQDLYNYVATIHEQGPRILLAGTFDWFLAVLQSRAFKSFLPSAKDSIGLGKVMGIAKEVVGVRFGPDKKVQRDMLGSFIAHGLTQEECESEVLVQILAGSDTSATTIRMTFLNVLNNARVLSKLLAEIDALHLPLDEVIGDSQAKKLPYLQAVIKEGIRFWPALGGTLRKTVPPEGEIANGFFIPGGTDIGFSAFSIQREKSFWGEDSDIYRPERWLEANPEKAKEMASVMELVFSYGKWQCLGKNVAFMELNKVFAELFRRFEFSLVDPLNPIKSSCVGVFLQSDMWLRIEKRDEKVNEASK